MIYVAVAVGFIPWCVDKMYFCVNQGHVLKLCPSFILQFYGELYIIIVIIDASRAYCLDL